MNYIFETEHLRVRKFEMSDAKYLYENHLEDEMKKWIPNESYSDINEAQDAVNFFSDCVQNKELPYVLAIERKDIGELIGDTGINEVEGHPQEVEIGYSIRHKDSGNGFATEIVKAMTEYAIENFNITVLYARIMHGNDASIKVVEKNGYVFFKEEFGAEDDPYGNGMLIYEKR